MRKLAWLSVLTPEEKKAIQHLLLPSSAIQKKLTYYPRGILFELEKHLLEDFVLNCKADATAKDLIEVHLLSSNGLSVAFNPFRFPEASAQEALSRWQRWQRVRLIVSGRTDWFSSFEKFNNAERPINDENVSLATTNRMLIPYYQEGTSHVDEKFYKNTLITSTPSAFAQAYPEAEEEEKKDSMCSKPLPVFAFPLTFPLTSSSTSSSFSSSSSSDSPSGRPLMDVVVLDEVFSRTRLEDLKIVEKLPTPSTMPNGLYNQVEMYGENDDEDEDFDEDEVAPDG